MGTFNPAGKSPKATQVKTNAGKSQPCLLFPLQAACLQRNSGLENSKKGRREEGKKREFISFEKKLTKFAQIRT